MKLPATYQHEGFRITVTPQGGRYRAAVVVGGGADHVMSGHCATAARVAEVGGADTPDDALAGAKVIAASLAESGEYRAWLGGDTSMVRSDPHGPD